MVQTQTMFKINKIFNLRIDKGSGGAGEFWGSMVIAVGLKDLI